VTAAKGGNRCDVVTVLILLDQDRKIFFLASLKLPLVGSLP
jgi:hypothetical protein